MIKIIIFLLTFNFYLIPAKADQLLEQGREIFLNQGNCASCHSLSDAKSDGSIGPNLNEIKVKIKINIFFIIYNNIYIIRQHL